MLQTDEYELRFICVVVLSLSRTKMVASAAFFCVCVFFSLFYALHFIFCSRILFPNQKTSGHVKVQLANNLHHLFPKLCCIANTIEALKPFLSLELWIFYGYILVQSWLRCSTLYINGAIWAFFVRSLFIRVKTHCKGVLSFPLDISFPISFHLNPLIRVTDTVWNGT